MRYVPLNQIFAANAPHQAPDGHRSLHSQQKLTVQTVRRWRRSVAGPRNTALLVPRPRTSCKERLPPKLVSRYRDRQAADRYTDRHASTENTYRQTVGQQVPVARPAGSYTGWRRATPCVAAAAPYRRYSATVLRGVRLCSGAVLCAVSQRNIANW